MESLTVAVHIEKILARLDAIARALEGAATDVAGLADADLEYATALRRELDVASRLALQARDVLAEGARRCDSAPLDAGGVEPGRERTTT